MFEISKMQAILCSVNYGVVKKKPRKVIFILRKQYQNNNDFNNFTNCITKIIDIFQKREPL